MTTTNEAVTESKKHIQRSPNYPVLSLGEALQRVATIYQHEKRAMTTAGVILKHLGYKVERGGLGGRTLSALRQYGLIEEQNGSYKISDAGYNLLHLPENSPERAAYLREAALRPAIFRELLNQYREGLPSDETLRSYLITKRGFNPDSVGKFIRVFRETVELAKLGPGDYTGGNEGEQEGAMPDALDNQDRTQSRPPAPGTAVQTYSWALSIPRNVRAELRLYGQDLRPEDVERLKRYLELLEIAFQDSKPEPGQAKETK